MKKEIACVSIVLSKCQFFLSMVERGKNSIGSTGDQLQIEGKFPEISQDWSECCYKYYEYLCCITHKFSVQI
jgi:hypothetical protein